MDSFNSKSDIPLENTEHIKKTRTKVVKKNVSQGYHKVKQIWTRSDLKHKRYLRKSGF